MSMSADWWLISLRFALYGVLSALFGLSAFALYARSGHEVRGAIRLNWCLTWGAILALLVSMVAIAFLAAAMAGSAGWPINRQAIQALLDGSAIGIAWKVRMSALALIVIVNLAAGERPIGLTLMVGASGVALATLAWSGHGAISDGPIGWTHLVSDVVHLLAAGAWVGALIALGWLIYGPSASGDDSGMTARAFSGFALAGSIMVGSIVVTGLINAWVLVEPAHVLELGNSLYGRLLMAKLVLFAAMLGLASINRFRLTPSLQCRIADGNRAGPLTALRLSIGIEFACAIAILALVAWLGTLEPPAASI